MSSLLAVQFGRHKPVLYFVACERVDGVGLLMEAAAPPAENSAATRVIEDEHTKKNEAY